MADLSHYLSAASGKLHIRSRCAFISFVYAAPTLGLFDQVSLQHSTHKNPDAHIVWLAYAYEKGCTTVTAFDITMLWHCFKPIASCLCSILCSRTLCSFCIDLFRYSQTTTFLFVAFGWLEEISRLFVIQHLFVIKKLQTKGR